MRPIETRDIQTKLDFNALRTYFNDNGITHAVMTTQVVRQFALLGGLKTLRHLSVAGEKLPPRAPESDRIAAGRVARVCTVSPDAVFTFCGSSRFTPNAFFNAAFGFALSRFIQPDDAVFTTVYNGRSDPRLASSVAMLVKTLPVLVRTEDFLAAFFTAFHPVDTAKLTESLRSKLAYYMAPAAAMMQLDAVPLTASGKIDRKALPEIRPESSASMSAALKT